MAEQDGKAEISDERAAELYEECRVQPAAIDAAQMHKLERAVRDDPHGVTRRVALATLAKPCAVLFDAVERDRAAAVSIAHACDALDTYCGHLQAVLDTMEAARLRMELALCGREDMDAIYAEARAGSADEPAEA